MLGGELDEDRARGRVEPEVAPDLGGGAGALFGTSGPPYIIYLTHLLKDKGAPVLPDDDEIVKGIRLTQGGKVVNERLTAA